MEKKALFQGIATAFERKRIIILLWLVNIAGGIVLALPLYSLLKNSFGGSFTGDSMLSRFDYLWFMQFKSQNDDLLSFIPAMIWGVGALYLLIQTFLSGGIIASFKTNPGSFEIKTFFEQCGNYFGKFLKLWIVSLITYFIVISFITAASGFILNDLIDGTSSERLAIFLTYFKYFIIIISFSILHIIFDYAKIKIVYNPDKYVLFDIMLSILFVIERIFSVIKIFVAITVLGIVFWAVYFVLDDMINPDSMFLIFIVFIIQQLYMIVRTWLRVSLLASEFHFFNSSQFTTQEEGFQIRIFNL